MIPGVEHRRFHSYDGTDIAYQVRGSGPVVVLANGLGGTIAAFRHILSALGDDYRVLCWDYRGLYDSGPPPNRAHVRVEHQVRDLQALLELEQVDRAIFIGWSMGVQVNFELFRQCRDRVAGIVAINGTAGRPFDTALGSRLIGSVIPRALRLAKLQSRPISKATQMAVAWDGLVPLMQRLGLVSHTLDIEVFREVAAGFATMDVGLYTDTLAKLGEHDAREVLPQIDVPTLIITGDRDRMTPPATAREMHASIRGARLVIVEGATHYTPVEFPRVVQDELMAFMGRVPGFSSETPGSAVGAPA